MIRNISKAIAIVSFSIILAGLIFGQEKSDDVLRVDTRLVSVPVIVSDRGGRYVPNLKAADFSIFQDGVKQEVEFFAATDEPITFALLIDTSQSTRAVLDDIKDSAVSFVRLLGPKDRGMIVSFDYDTHILSDVTGDRRQLERAIYAAEIPEPFGTTLRDAVDDTVNRSFAKIQGRKAIILMTDGKDARSNVSSEDLLYTLQETDTLIYTILFKTNERQAMRQILGGGRRGGIFGGGMGGRFPGGGNNRRRNERIEEKNRDAADFLRSLSDTTAGRFYESEDGKLQKTFASIVEELRYQYRLGFYPREDTAEINGSQLHQLRVKVARPNIVVRSRNSYRVVKTSSDK